MLKKMIDKIKNMMGRHTDFLVDENYEDYEYYRAFNFDNKEWMKKRFREFSELFDSFPNNNAYEIITTTTHTKRKRINYVTTRKNHNGY